MKFVKFWINLWSRVKQLPKRKQLALAVTSGVIVIGIGLLIWSFSTGKIRPFAAAGDISNFATATYTDASGATRTVNSNTVATSIEYPPSAFSLSGSVISSSQINISWTASFDTDSTPLTNYNVYRNGGTIPIKTVSATTLSYSDTGLTPGTAYTYQIGATDGVAETKSNILSLTTKQDSALSTVDLRVNRSNGPVTINSGKQVTISWTSQNVSSCTASGSWSGSKSVSGNWTSPALSSASNFILICTGTSGSTQDSVQVNIRVKGAK